MKPAFVLALLLIAAGIVALAYQGFTYTTREKVVDIGALHVMADKTHSVPLSPLLGVLAIAGGLVLVVVGNRKA